MTKVCFEVFTFVEIFIFLFYLSRFGTLIIYHIIFDFQKEIMQQCLGRKREESKQKGTRRDSARCKISLDLIIQDCVEDEDGTTTYDTTG